MIFWLRDGHKMEVTIRGLGNRMFLQSKVNFCVGGAQWLTFLVLPALRCSRAALRAPI
jgi:hypothetical protein